MARSSRHSVPSSIPADSRIYFVTSKTAQGKALLQTEHMASLFVDVLRRFTTAGVFTVHELVVMHNHLYVLVGGDVLSCIEWKDGNRRFR
jgi:REP element-mobilizing transposase RayT